MSLIKHTVCISVVVAHRHSKKMEALAILLSLFLAGMASLALYFRRNRGHLETLGIPIDPPMFMFGSSPWALHKVMTQKTTSVNSTEFPIPSFIEVFRLSFREFPRLVGSYYS